MTLFMLSIPLMVLAVAIAVIPLIVCSHAEHRERIRSERHLAASSETARA